MECFDTLAVCVGALVAAIGSLVAAFVAMVQHKRTVSKLKEVQQDLEMAKVFINNLKV